MSKGNRLVDQSLYDCILEGFRKHRGSISKVLEFVKADERSGGVMSRPTLNRAYYKGWPRRGLDPICEVLDKEKQAATAVVNAAQAEEDREILGTDAPLEPLDEIDNREKTRHDAIIARAAEAKLVRESRANIVSLLESSKELLRGYGHLSKEVSKFLEGATVETMEDARRASNLLWRLAITSSTATASGMRVLQMERLLLGQPMEIIGTKDVEEISDEDALIELEEAAKVAERIRARRERDFHLSGLLSGNLAAHGFDDKSNGKKAPSKGNGVN